MKTKHLFLLVLPLCLGLVSCSSDANEFTGTHKATLYQPDSSSSSGDTIAKAWATLDLGITKTYGTDEPFMTVDAVLSILASNGDISKDNLHKQISSSQITYYVEMKPADLTITVDCAANTVTFSDFASYVSHGSDYYVDTTDHNASHCFTVTGNSYKNNSAVTFDLGAYDVDILLKDRSAYLPFTTCSHLFLLPWTYLFGWNGQDIYYISGSSCLLIDSSNLTSYAKQYYGGPLNGKTPSAEVARLHGNQSMFYLDHFYGLKDDARFGGMKFSEYLKDNHNEYYNLFFSTGTEDSQKAWDYTIKTVIGDGHSAVVNNLGSVYAGGEFTSTASYSERRQSLARILNDLTALRKEKLGLEEDGSLTLDKMLEISGDTAIIRYDSFRFARIQPTLNAYQYRQYATYDNYSLFAYAFSEIEMAGGVSKVVIDLTLNTGGAIAGCLEAIGFLKNTYSQTFIDTVSGCLSTITMKGIYPYGRTASYEGEYQFYVMISGGSFSCGSLFPAICKSNGIATLIGEQSGGGGCSVGYLISPTGQFIQISSIRGISKEGGTETIDSGIAPDYELDKSYFYDTASLKEWLSTIN